MKDYHKTIQEAILDFGNLHLHKKIISISKGNEILYIQHRTKDKLKALTFKPDGIFTLKKGKSRVVFQVLDSQAKRNREIEADIFRAYFCPGVAKLVFIVPTEEDLENVSRISSIIQDNLERYGSDFDIGFSLTLLIPKTVRNRKSALSYLTPPRTSNEIFR